MKSKERHHLKQNEFAASAARVGAALAENWRQTVVIAVAAVVVLAAVGGYLSWRRSVADRAGAMLGIAHATAQAPIAPPATLPGATQAEGTYPTEQARSEAALEAFQGVTASYPSTPSALTATYEAAGQLVNLGRFEEAETLYAEVEGADSMTYSPMARMGLAQVKLAAGQYDEAVILLTDLTGDRDGVLPIDGVLIQLGEAYVKAGKPEDARATYRRVVDEFADSVYAPDARQRLAAMN